jgi:hypothetical protein
VLCEALEDAWNPWELQKFGVCIEGYALSCKRLVQLFVAVGSEHSRTMCRCVDTGTAQVCVDS